jgi:hypothetical protein
MKRQKLEIGKPLAVEVTWYDTCTAPPRDEKHEGEVVGWRESQVIVSIKDYAVVRFWKRSGIEVGNKDHLRRGFRLDINSIAESTRPAQGVSVTFPDDDGPVSILRSCPPG